MTLYAAYGSNLDPTQMRRRCPSSPLRDCGWLPGWRLTFGGEDLGWDGPLPTVVEDPDSHVYVALYEVSDADEASLDRWESADTGLFAKLHVRVQTLEGDSAAYVYVLDAFEGGLPSARTRDLVADAAEAGGAPPDYVDALRSRPTLEDLGGG